MYAKIKGAIANGQNGCDVKLATFNMQKSEIYSQ